jgi:hypothetical protein
MVAPGSRLQNVVFRGFTKVWFNGSPTADSYGIDMVSFQPGSGTLMGLAIADATADVTFKRCTSDNYGIQQATSRIQTLNLVDCQVTTGIIVNQDVNFDRVFNFLKTVSSRITTTEATYPLRILNSTGVVQTITQTPGAETSAEINWAVITNPGSNSATSASMTAANILTATTDTNFNITRRLPLKLQFNDYRYRRIERTIDATTLALTTAAAKDSVVLTGIAELDPLVNMTQAAAAAVTGITITKATGTATPANPHVIRITNRNITLDQIYCFWKQWFVQDAQWDVSDQLTANGSKLVLGNYRITTA